ncbi:unnamed protein product [Parascedosporium putredinis]|uniref:Uncharacterized protein n=1 Tax=Parascedosporium putredinis TaxID=1442378 RepID=A0A9P1MFI2_9PEZI|nr:unnamed protein product [Parascedosporium putredinis]CAI8002414.1 unnamed protein product [Parascedosporium putredinis]
MDQSIHSSNAVPTNPCLLLTLKQALKHTVLSIPPSALAKPHPTFPIQELKTQSKPPSRRAFATGHLHDANDTISQLYSPAVEPCRLQASPIEAMEKSLGIPVPEMIFGDNVVGLHHKPSGWSFSFNAYNALDAVGKTAENMLQVAYARDWASSRENSSGDINKIVNPYDWSYSTDYAGTLEQGSKAFATTDKAIPLELLKRRDPILFFDEVVLYESELDDNGVSSTASRVDNVIIRVRDTRVYVDFETDEVIKEYCAREDSFANVKKALLMSGRLPDDITISCETPMCSHL